VRSCWWPSSSCHQINDNQPTNPRAFSRMWLGRVQEDKRTWESGKRDDHVAIAVFYNLDNALAENVTSPSTSTYIQLLHSYNVSQYAWDSLIMEYIRECDTCLPSFLSSHPEDNQFSFRRRRWESAQSIIQSFSLSQYICFSSCYFFLVEKSNCVAFLSWQSGTALSFVCWLLHIYIQHHFFLSERTWANSNGLRTTQDNFMCP
jgi:hypothetical protein